VFLLLRYHHVMEKMVYWCFEASQLPVCIQNVNLKHGHLSFRHAVSVLTDCVDGWVLYCRAPRSMSSCSRTCARSVIGCHIIVCISGNKYIYKTNKISPTWQLPDDKKRSWPAACGCQTRQVPMAVVSPVPVGPASSWGFVLGIYFAGRGMVHTFKAWCYEEQLFFVLCAP